MALGVCSSLTASRNPAGSLSRQVRNSRESTKAQKPMTFRESFPSVGGYGEILRKKKKNEKENKNRTIILKEFK